MSSGVNRVILVGNLGADPEVRFTQGGQSVANFRLAVSESWVDKQGERKERTEWVPVVAWGKQAEHCGEYLKKGRQCYVEGKLQTREWEKDGVKRYTTEVVASSVTFLGSGAGGGSRSRGPEQEPSQGGQDDIPF